MDEAQADLDGNHEHQKRATSGEIRTTNILQLYAYLELLVPLKG